MLSTSVNPVSFNPHRCSGRLLGVLLYTEEDIGSKGAYASGPRPLNSICVCTHARMCVAVVGVGTGGGAEPAAWQVGSRAQAPSTVQSSFHVC